MSHEQVKEIVKKLAENEIKEIEKNVLSLENAFDFLDHVRDELDVGCCYEVMFILKNCNDDLLALEADQTLRELLPYLDSKSRDELERELYTFNNRVANALVNSDLVDISDDVNDSY
ncbi:MAG: hypothetical protein ACTSP4_17430 [Candidatus Hodarchaeales archaeon]